MAPTLRRPVTIGSNVESQSEISTLEGQTWPSIMRWPCFDRAVWRAAVNSPAGNLQTQVLTPPGVSEISYRPFECDPLAWLNGASMARRFLMAVGVEKLTSSRPGALKAILVNTSGFSGVDRTAYPRR